MKRTLLCLGLAAAAGAVGCEDKPSRVDEMLSAATNDEPPPPAPRDESTEVPPILVDTLGAVIGSRRAKDLDKPHGKKKLAELVAEVPFTDEPVRVKALAKAKVPDVVETVWQLGAGGVKKIIVASDGREGLPSELVLTPQQLVKDPPGCSVVAMVTDNADTGVWPLEGGGGRRARKGMAGPDLSRTGEYIESYLKRCDSEYGFFSTAANMPWEHAFAMGGLLEKHDPEDEIRKLVLLGDEPVAGREVKLRR